MLSTIPNFGLGNLFSRKYSCSLPVTPGKEPWLVFIRNVNSSPLTEAQSKTFKR